MDEARFWSMIEQAWQNVEGVSELRAKLAQGELSEEDARELAERSCMEVVPSLQSMLQQLGKEELVQFDRILERKLYDIDRSDIHEYTGGSDDGFLYARGFIVAAGREYFEAVSAAPSRAMMDLECEDICYLSARIYEGKYGDMPDSGITRESAFKPGGRLGRRR